MGSSKSNVVGGGIGGVIWKKGRGGVIRERANGAKKQNSFKGYDDEKKKRKKIILLTRLLP